MELRQTIRAEPTLDEQLTSLASCRIHESARCVRGGMTVPVRHQPRKAMPWLASTGLMNCFGLSTPRLILSRGSCAQLKVYLRLLHPRARMAKPNLGTLNQPMMKP